MRRSLHAFGILFALSLVAVHSAHGQIAIEHQKLLAGDGAAGDEFGIDVLVVGDTIVVSADQDNSGRGAVYVYEYQDDATWAQLQKLTAGNAGADDQFGCSISLDGDWLAVGAKLEDSGGSGAGSVYLFENQAGTWVQTQRIQAGDRAAADFFGTTVALEGATLAVGSIRDDAKGTNSGAVYIFEESAGTWSQTAKLLASDGDAIDQFGSALDIEGDLLLIGTLFDDSLTGAAYVFERQGGGGWTELQKLTANDATPGDEFGCAVAIDGDLILLGARTEKAQGNNAGAVYAFEWNGSSWVQTDKFFGSDTDVGDQFGFSLGLDGTRAVIGAYREDPAGTLNGGQGYVFERRPSGQWVQLARVRASDTQDADLLGWSSSISGNRVVLGAVWEDGNGAESGAAYVAESEFLRSRADLSVTNGGTVDYFLSLGVAKAGAQYWVLGSISGNTPGANFNGVPIPLNFDLYLLLTIKSAGRPPFDSSLGTLDSDGQATFSLSVPGGLDPALIGLQIDHAATTYTSSPIRFQSSSEATRITLVN